MAVCFEKRWIVALGKRPDPLDGLLGFCLHLVDERRGAGCAFLGGQLPGEAQLDLERHHLLLGAIVEVTLQLAAFDVLGVDEATP